MQRAFYAGRIHKLKCEAHNMQREHHSEEACVFSLVGSPRGYRLHEHDECFTSTLKHQHDIGSRSYDFLLFVEERDEPGSEVARYALWSTYVQTLTMFLNRWCSQQSVQQQQQEE